MNNIKIVNVIWFNQMGSPDIIGIVKVDNGFDIKFYIGTASGHDLIGDEEHIAETGAKFPLEAGLKLMP